MFIVMFNKGTATALAVVDTRQPSVRILESFWNHMTMPSYGSHLLVTYIL